MATVLHVQLCLSPYTLSYELCRLNKNRRTKNPLKKAFEITRFLPRKSQKKETEREKETFPPAPLYKEKDKEKERKRQKQRRRRKKKRAVKKRLKNWHEKQGIFCVYTKRRERLG